MTDERMAEVLTAHADSIEARPSEQLLSRTIEKEMLIPALRHGAGALRLRAAATEPVPERPRWELDPLTAERLQEEFDRRVETALRDVYLRGKETYTAASKRVLREVLAEIGPLPKEEPLPRIAFLLYEGFHNGREVKERLECVAWSHEGAREWVHATLDQRYSRTSIAIKVFPWAEAK